MSNENHVSIGKNDAKMEEVAGSATPEADEDVDVEILYMRLKALRSMKEKLDNNEDDEMVDEMEELLHEADQAANEVELDFTDYVPTSPSPLIQDDDEAGLDLMMKSSLTDDTSTDDMSMSSVVKRLKEAARKTRETEHASSCEELESYSPTQSPIRDVTNDIDVIDIDLIDRASSPVDDEDPVIVYDKPKPVEVVDLENETEAEVQFFKQQREEPLFPSSVWEFQQKPPSTSVKNETAYEATASANHLEAFHMAVMAQSKTVQRFRRKRARSRGKSLSVSDSTENKPPPEKSAKGNLEHLKEVVEEEEDDEKALRAAVLSSMAVKRTKKIENEEKNTIKQKPTENKKPPSLSPPPPLPPPLPLHTPSPPPLPLPTAPSSTPSVVVKAKKAEKIPTKSAPKVNKLKKVTASEKKKQLEAKRKLIIKKAKYERDLKKLKDELNKWQDKTVKNKAEAMPLARKYFPNIFMKKVIISSKDLIESDDEDENMTKAPPTGQFQKDLDDFMKGLRSQSKKTEDKPIPPPKPVRKFPPKRAAAAPVSAVGTSQAQKSKILQRTLSSADKEILKKSNISHLPPDKQMEYKKLLNLLAQKEKAKKAEKALTVSISKNGALRTVTCSKSDQPAVGQSLTVPEISNPGTKQNSNAAVSNIKADSKKEKLQVTSVGTTSLKEKESKLIKARSEMCASLYKLSAEVSQLKEETSKKETAEAFLEKLQRQVAVTSELITRKNERINKLKTVVRQSHQDVVTKSQSMSILKKQCKTMGTALKGTDYQPPKEGMDTIRKKLTVINNSAKKVNTTATSTPPPTTTTTANNEASSIVKSVEKAEEESDSDTSDSDDDDSDSGSSSSSAGSPTTSEDEDEAGGEQAEKKDSSSMPKDNSSSLAHLNKSNIVLDPQVELCRFDLQGRCNDNACPYQHLRAKPPALH